VADTRRGDVESFDRRAASYDAGRLGRWHGQVVASVADLVASRGDAAQAHVLDIGCGTGRLIDTLSQRLPQAASLTGVDPAAAMLEVAASRCSDPRVRLEQAGAERLPLADHSTDLALASLSFDHWSDQAAGLREVARVLAPDGALVLADLVAWWLPAARLLTRRRRARTVGAVDQALRDAGLRPVRWRRVTSLGPVPLVQAVVALPV
jgi:ubiquinone/menaquinone biosynthesis C-methylase UbiE